MQLSLAGVTDIAIRCGPEAEAELASEAAAAGQGWLTGRAAEDHIRERAAATPGAAVLVIDGNQVVDERLIAALAAASVPAAFAPGGPAGAIISAAELVGSGPPPYAEVLARPGTSIIDAGSLPHFWLAQRRRLLPFQFRVETAPELAQATAAVINAAGKGHQEWTVILFNRPVEEWLSRWLTRLAITPNQITGLSIAAGLAAALLLALGRLWPGLALCAATMILDGLDGRQARVQLRFSPAGELEHVADKLVEAGWLAGLGLAMARLGHSALPLWGALVWVALVAADNFAGSFFRARRGFLPDLARPVDSLIRLVATRRNTNIAYFALGLAAGVPVAAFWAILAASAVFMLLHWLRTVQLLARAPAAPWLADEARYPDAGWIDWLFGVPAPKKL